MSPIKLFETRQVRSIWDAERELWFFSIVDVVSVLTDSADANAYWRKLKQRLKAEGNETVTNCHGLKMSAADGKMRLTDVADTEQLLRLVQSIPSPKAEPFKQWLAQVGYERIEETEDPERALDRAMETYLKKGYSREWVNQRLKSIELRKDLTDEWEERGIQKGRDFAILTDEITRAWSGFNTREYKQAKDLKKENLRDHMSNLELVLNMLAEPSTTEISRQKQPEGFEENRVIARQGGTIAGNTRKEIEEKNWQAGRYQAERKATQMIAVPTAIPEVLKIQNPQGKLVRVVLGEVFDVAVDLRKRTKILSQKPWRPRFCVFPNRGVLRHELNACGGLNPISHPTGSESPSVFTPNTNLPCPAKTNSSAKFCASGR